jgi:FkbM family methyltransferase
MSFLKKREGIRIEKVGSSYLIKKEKLEIFSPTPKFLGFGFREFESKFEEIFKIKEGETVADIGACIGDTTLPMCVKVGQTGHVIAVEPHPVNVGYLKLNLKLKGFNNVEVIEKAVWCKKETMELNIHDTPTGHSLLSHETRKLKIQIDADTLDNIFGDKKIDFAKIDVQGAEVEVLRGGMNSFLKNTKKIIVETHKDKDNVNRLAPKVIEILKSCGYVTYLTRGYVVHAKKI